MRINKINIPPVYVIISLFIPAGGFLCNFALSPLLSSYIHRSRRFTFCSSTCRCASYSISPRSCLLFPPSYPAYCSGLQTPCFLSSPPVTAFLPIEISMEISEWYCESGVSSQYYSAERKITDRSYVKKNARLLSPCKFKLDLPGRMHTSVARIIWWPLPSIESWPCRKRSGIFPLPHRPRFSLARDVSDICAEKEFIMGVQRAAVV